MTLGRGEPAMTGRPPYWFPAKRYGWGWGPPRVWQGWVVMAVFAILVLAGAIMQLPTYFARLRRIHRLPMRGSGRCLLGQGRAAVVALGPQVRPFVAPC